MFRKTMFITCPTRDALTSHRKLIEALMELEGSQWRGNRDAHFRLEALLVEKGIKADGISDYGSGGRTWAALARTFGYWYPDGQGRIVLTPVAKAIAAGIDEHLHVQKQIMNYQIPNGYVLSEGFSPKYDNGYRIFPFRFMLKMLCDPQLNHYLHRDEISLFFLTARHDADYNTKRSEIIYYRTLQQQDGVALHERDGLLDTIAIDYDHRRRRDSSSVDFLDYLRDSALTHMIIMESVNYRWFDRSDGRIILKSEFVTHARTLLDHFEERYPFSTRYKISEAAFTRHYGLDLSRSKNTFRSGQRITSRQQKQLIMVKEAAEQVLSNAPIVDNETLVRAVQAKFPLDEEDIVTVLRQSGLLKHESLGRIDSHFIDSYLECAIDSNLWSMFERQSMKLLNAMTDGAFRPEGARKTYDAANIEIGVRLRTTRSVFGGILDCKSGQKFQLSTKDRDLMASSYIPKYQQLKCPDGLIVPLRFYGYVVGEGFSGQRNFRLIPKKAKAYLSSEQVIDGFVINARTLLFLAELYSDQEVDTDDLLRVFTSNEVFTEPVQIQWFLECE